MAEFCELEGYSSASFYQWRRKLADDQTLAVPAFVPVDLPASDLHHQHPESITVELPGVAQAKNNLRKSECKAVLRLAAEVLSIRGVDIFVGQWSKYGPALVHVPQYATYACPMTAVSAAHDRLFFEIAETWLEYQEKREQRGEVSSQWLQRVTGTISRFDRAHAGIRTADVTPAVLYTWLKDRSSSYERTEFATLKQCLKWVHKSGLIERDPLENLELPPESHRERILTLSEHRKLCRHSNVQFRQLLRFAWLTGCRPTELRELRWEQLSEDLSKATIVKHKTVRKVKKPRVICFPDKAQALLRKRPQESGYVFLNTRGRWASNQSRLQSSDTLCIDVEQVN